MTIVADFTLISGDSPITIGDGNTQWTKDFFTGGRHNSPAILLFNVRGLTAAVQSVEVKVNGIEVGRIFPYSLANGAANNNIANQWFTQMIALGGSQIRGNGTNQLSIRAVGYPNSPSNDNFDDFQLKDVVLFFHQNA